MCVIPIALFTVHPVRVVAKLKKPGPKHERKRQQSEEEESAAQYVGENKVASGFMDGLRPGLCACVPALSPALLCFQGEKASAVLLHCSSTRFSVSGRTMWQD